MVFCGRPSMSCDSCRQRRIKCDKAANGCGQCIRKSITCTGYRDQAELMFRDQSKETAWKARKKYATHNLITGGQTGSTSSGLAVIVQDGDDGQHSGNDLPNEGALLPISSPQPFHPRLVDFENYPRSERQRVIHCLDYYLKFCGPNYVWRQEVITHGSLRQFTQTFVQTSFAEPAFLEIVLAICQADFNSRCQNEEGPTEAPLAHRARALYLLRTKLVASGSATDEVLLAIVIAMLVFDMTVSDWKSYEIHLRYLRRTLSTEATEELGWQGWFAYTYAWAELRWANHIASRARDHAAPRGLKSRLNWSRQSMITELWTWSWSLPVGFHGVIHTGCLDEEIVKLLVDVTHWTEQCAEMKADVAALGSLNIHGIRLATQFAKVYGSVRLTTSASLICIGVIAYITSHVEGPSGHSRGLEDLTWSIGNLDLYCSDEDWYMWVAMALAAANDTFPTTLPHRWTLLDRLVESSTSRLSWDEVHVVVQKFFWDDRHVDSWKLCLKTSVERRITEI